MPVDKNDNFNGDYRHQYMNESGTDIPGGWGDGCCLFAPFYFIMELLFGR